MNSIVKKSIVSITSKKDYPNLDEQVKVTIELCGGKDILKKEWTYLIKPNWIIDEHWTRGNTTSTDTLESIVKYLINDIGVPPANITLGDGGYPHSTKDTMKTNDVFRLEKYGIIVRDMNDDQLEVIEPKKPFALKKVNFSKTALNTDCVISVPSLKTHGWAVTTLSLKNIMGLILPKGIMHSSLHEKIADLASIIRDRMHISIIDGSIGSNGSEEGGEPMNMGLIMASQDPVALDTVGTYVMCWNENQAKYLQYAAKKGLGTCDLDEIEVVGKQIHEVRKKFDR